MSLNLIILCTVIFVWGLGIMLSVLAEPGKNGTSGGMGVFIFTWIFVLCFSVAMLIGYCLTFFIGGIAYLITLMALIIFGLWFWKR
jgi:hypothetical protein